MTTVDTLPISKAPFPVVTVCPPNGTNTLLNYDIMAAKNVTFDNNTRFAALEVAKTSLYESFLSVFRYDFVTKS